MGSVTLNEKLNSLLKDVDRKELTEILFGAKDTLVSNKTSTYE